jgi:hypothetical protein
MLGQIQNLPEFPVCMKTFLTMVLLSALFSCVSGNLVEDWPQELPDQGYFARIYRADADNRVLQSEKEYLTWVARFYDGWELMPMGWNDIAESVLMDLELSDYQRINASLTSLAVQISGEWAKDNQVRRIDSAMLSLWGGVMQADFSPDYRIAAVEMIREDVADILAGVLAPEQVTEARYVDELGVSLDP